MPTAADLSAQRIDADYRESAAEEARLEALVERQLALPPISILGDCLGREIMFDGHRCFEASFRGIHASYRIFYSRLSDTYQPEQCIRGIWKPIGHPLAQLGPCYGVLRAHWIAYATRALGGVAKEVAA